MSKAIVAAIIIFVLGCLGIVIGLEFLGGYTELAYLLQLLLWVHLSFISTKRRNKLQIYIRIFKRG